MAPALRKKYKVCKFGGSSLATREKIDYAIDIMLKEPDLRKFMVVSAFGEGDDHPTKMTNLLIHCADAKLTGAMSSDEIVVVDWINEICREDKKTAGELEKEFRKRIEADKKIPGYYDSIVAFGEYASATCIASILNQRRRDAFFADPMTIGIEAIVDGPHVYPNDACYEHVGEMIRPRQQGERAIAVIAGFYAKASDDGRLVTLPRQGTDITGAVIANAIDALEYENWTDEPGLRMADPNVFKRLGLGIKPRIIPELTYEEAEELISRGFKLHEETIIPLMAKKIPLRVRSTRVDEVDLPGTRLVYERVVSPDEYIVGIASEPGFISINMSMPRMNKQAGFGANIFGVLANTGEYGIPFEHAPTGTNTMSVIVRESDVNESGMLSDIMRKFDETAGPMNISVGERLAMVSIAGLGIKNHLDTDSKILGALADAGIPHPVLNKGYSELSFSVGVPEAMTDRAVAVIYGTFSKKAE